MEKELMWLKRTAIRMRTLFASNCAGYFLLLSITMIMTMNST